MNKLSQFLTLLLITNGLFCSAVFAQSEALLAKLEKKRIHIAAHRAAHAIFPENSIAALEAAIALDVTIAEVDVRSTKDGILVLLHDSTLDRTTTGKGKIQDFTYAEIKQLYLRQSPGGAATTQQIPTLAEALNVCKGKILLDLDFKEERKEYMAKTYALIEKEGMTDEVLFFLYDYKDMKKMYRINPKITLFPRARSIADVQQIVKSKLTRVIHIDDSFTETEQLNAWKSQGIYFWMNSLGDVDDEAALKGAAVYQSFLTQYPYIKIIQTDSPTLWNDTLTSYENN